MKESERYEPPKYYTLFVDKDNPPLQPPPIPPPNTPILSSDTYWNMSYRVPIDMIGRLESTSEKEFLKQLNDKLFLLFMQYFHEKIYEPEIGDDDKRATLWSIAKVYDNIMRRLNIMREEEAYVKLEDIQRERQKQCDESANKIMDIVDILSKGNIQELRERFIKQE